MKRIILSCSMVSQDNPYIVIGDDQLFVSCYILEELRRLPHLGNIFPHLLVVRKALNQGLFKFNGVVWHILTHYLHQVLIKQVMFLNIAGKVLNIEAPPTNEDDSITHLNAKVLNRAEKVLKTHFWDQLSARYVFCLPCKLSCVAKSCCHLNSW